MENPVFFPQNSIEYNVVDGRSSVIVTKRVLRGVTELPSMYLSATKKPPGYGWLFHMPKLNTI